MVRRPGIVSYYNADPAQTDDSPCYTADMTFICPAEVNVVANNCLAFGTQVTIDGTVYEVHDKMNPRYSCEYFDILVDDYLTAINLGRQHKLITI